MWLMGQWVSRDQECTLCDLRGPGHNLLSPLLLGTMGLTFSWDATVPTLAWVSAGFPNGRAVCRAETQLLHGFLPTGEDTWGPSVRLVQRSSENQGLG